MSGRNHIIGVDLGGTTISVGAVPVDGGTVLGMRTLPTDAHIGAKFVVDRIVSMIHEVKRDAAREGGFGEDAIVGVGMGAPGPLDRDTGTVIEAMNLGWRNFPLRDLIVKGTGLETELDNDANAATLGEWWQGAGRGVDNLVGVTLGTGIGGGIILNGALYHGASDAAAEIGYMTIDPAGRKCACGNYGCLEAYASGPAIAARAVEGLKAGAKSMLLDLVEGDLRAITAEAVSDAIVAGDEYAAEVMRETAGYLGTGLANLINILNPEMIVVSGGVTRAGRHLFDPLRREVRKRALRPAAEACRIVRTELGGLGGVIGAAAVFRVARLGPL